MAFIATTIASAAIGYLTNKSLDYLKDLLTAADQEKLEQSLTGKLPMIQSISDAIGQNLVLETESAPLEEWLWQLRTAIEKGYDAIDELEFYNLELARQQNLSALSQFRKLQFGASQVLKKIGSSCQNLKTAIEKLDSIASGVGNFIAIVDRIKGYSGDHHYQKHVLLRETSRILSANKVVGRDAENDKLVQWLTTGQSAESDVVAVAVVGIGGMGKTTLAQLVCEDSRVNAHFANNIVWIHVSSHFNPAVLTKMIVQSITKQKPDIESLDLLQASLMALLKKQKILLILDDTWEDSQEHDEWHKFLAPLCQACAGSRILVTTRMSSVLYPIECAMKRHGKQFRKLDIGGLGSTDMLELFNSCAFSGSEIDVQQDLKLISEQIVKKFIGSPLVATAVGRHLWNVKDRSQWHSILNKKFQYFAGPAVMDVLQLSYLNLPSEVQACFRYCSMFLLNYRFKMEDLIDMWIGSGLVLPRHQDGLSMEATASEYFNILERKSVLSLASPTEDHYIMHELVYELACSVSSKEVVRLEATDYNSHGPLPPTVRHIYIEGLSCKCIEYLSQSKCPHLRTLVVKAGKDGAAFSDPRVEASLKKIIEGSKGLRVLILHGSNCSVLKIPMSKLKHIRYLSMSNISEADLCKAFKLHHMEVIKIPVVSCQSEKILNGIANLRQLRKLNLPEGTLSRICHIGHLTTLQELCGFAVRAKTGHGHHIEELKPLVRLQKLSIHEIQNISDYVEASVAELNCKSQMRLLSLKWSSAVHHDEEVLENLAPVKDLKELAICGYTNVKHPKWMNARCLPNLVHLRLEGFAGWIHLPTLKMLQTLKHLYLGHLINSAAVPSTLRRDRSAIGIGSEEDWMPPCLTTLVVERCPALLKLPSLPLTLRLLAICEAGVNHLPTPCVNQINDASAQLSELRIESCYQLDSHSCLQHLGDYKALIRLSIIHCTTLDFLPARSVFQGLSELEVVHIDDCEHLFSLGGLGSLRRLRELTIKKCPCLVSSSSCPRPMAEPSMLIETLEIDDHNLLSVKPLCDLNSTKHLLISDGSKMTALPLNWLERNISALQSIEVLNATVLESLPTGMEKCMLLRTICLTNVLVLQLPTSMPPNLWALSIKGCGENFKSIYGRGGPKWKELNYIPVVTIS